MSDCCAPVARGQFRMILKKKNSGAGKNELQAASSKLDKAVDLGYSRIMQTFIFEDKEYQFKNMEEANDKLPLGDGAWFGPQDNSTLAEFTYKWEKGNFFD